MKIFLTLIWFSQALSVGQSVGTVKAYETMEQCNQWLAYEMANPKDPPAAGFCGELPGVTIKRIGFTAPKKVDKTESWIPESNQ